MRTELKKSIFRAAVFLAGGYFGLLVAAVVATGYLQYISKSRLATSYFRSSRNSLVTRDYRQAASILDTAVESGFSAVAFYDRRGEVVFALPDHSREAFLSRSFWSSTEEFEVRIGEAQSVEPIGRLRFSYYWAPPFLFVVSCWAVLLIPVIPIFSKIRKGIIERYNEDLRIAEALLIKKVTAQLAHDIRSPLAALETVSNSELEDIQSAQLLREAIERIRNIAEDFLIRERAGGVSAPRPERGVSDCLNALESLIAEKQLQFKETAFRFRHNGQPVRLKSSISDTEFRRMFSNLINNAAEAAESGEVEVVVSNLVFQVEIQVIDTGRGIPPEILSKLGQRGLSFDKGHVGNGLGVPHAFECIEMWGGQIRFSSAVGKGTTVKVNLPSDLIESKPPVVLVENDRLNIEVWNLSARRAAINLDCFSTVDAISSKLKTYSRETIFFLDADMGDDQPSGIEIARLIHDSGFPNVYLATGRAPSAFDDVHWLKGVVGKDPPWL